MAYISKITLPNGLTYDIKDAEARQLIAALGAPVKYIGVTTTVLADNDTTSTIVVGGVNHTAAEGDVAIYGDLEFIFNGTKWQEFGKGGLLKALAFKDTATGSYTPAGSVSQPTFEGTTMTATGSYTPAGSVSVSLKTTSTVAAAVTTGEGATNYTPAGSVSAPAFTGSSVTSTGKFTPEGNVSLSTTAVNVAVGTSSGTSTYTPAGSVAAPTISLKTTGSTSTIHNPTAVTVATGLAAAAPGQTAPANAITYYETEVDSTSGDVTLKLYQLGYTTGASITTTDVDVKTGDAEYEADAPTFTGTGVRLVTNDFDVPSSASFSGTQGDLSVTGTSAGSVAAPTFSGTGVHLVTEDITVPSEYAAEFEGTSATVSVTGTPAGTVSQPTFTGTAATITVS